MEPVSAGLWASCSLFGSAFLGNIVANVVSGLVYDAGKDAHARISRAVAEGLSAGKLPPNHDLRKAYREALKLACAFMHRAVEAEVGEKKPFLPAMMEKWRARTLFKEPLIHVRDTPAHDWLGAFGKLSRDNDRLGEWDAAAADLPPGEADRLLQADVDQRLSDAARDHLSAWARRHIPKPDPPPPFADGLAHGFVADPQDRGRRVTFYQSICLFFREHLKANPQAFNAYVIAVLARLSAGGGGTGTARDVDEAAIAAEVFKVLGERLGPNKDYFDDQFATVNRKLDEIKEEIKRQHREHPAKPVELVLRPARKDFTGRDAEKKEFLKAFDQGGLLIYGFQGQGGIGKTELAVVLGHAVKDRFPDGQVMVDLRGTDPEPPPWPRVMEQIIRRFGEAGKLPDDPRQLADYYHGLLKGKRVLLVLDNAADAEQVEPLLPAEPCGVIITSRRFFPVQGVQPRQLDQLKRKDALKLARELGERLNKAQATRLIDACGLLALAVRVAATTIAQRRALAVDKLIEQLEANRLAQLPEVEAALKQSYDLLDDDLKVVWPTLGVFPASFDPPAAAALCGADGKLAAEAAAEQLDRLFQVSMVQLDERTERFRLHDLARDYAMSLLDEAGRHAAGLRHAQYFSAVLRAANDEYNRGGAKVLSGLAMFDAERTNVETAFAWAAGRAESDDDAARVAAYMPASGVYVLDIRIHAIRRAQWIEAGLAGARRLKHRALEGVHLGNLGLTWFALGDARKAAGYYEQALAVAREIGDRRGEGNALGNLGSAWAALGDAYRAAEFYEQQLVAAREVGDRRGEGNALSGLGIAWAALGDAPKAAGYSEQAFEVMREIGDRRGEGNALGNVGNAWADLGDARKAADYYEQALAVAREIGDRLVEGVALGNLGKAWSNLGDARKAAGYYDQRLAIAREIGDRRGEGNALFNSAVLRHSLGEPAAAQRLAAEALAIYEAIESPTADVARRFLERIDSSGGRAE